MLRKAAILTILGLPFATAPALLPTPTAAAPVELTDAQLEEEAAGRRSHGWGHHRPHRGFPTLVVAPQISIVNQIAIAIAIGGTATATNVAYTFQFSGIGSRFR